MVPSPHDTQGGDDPIHRASMDSSGRATGSGSRRWLEPGGNLPEHFHPTLTETWEVVDGSAGVKLDGAWRELTAADGPVLVNPYARHALRNTSDAPRACAAGSRRPAGSRSS